jgi:hypothetical protein
MDTATLSKLIDAVQLALGKLSDGSDKCQIQDRGILYSAACLGHQFFLTKKEDSITLIELLYSEEIHRSDRSDAQDVVNKIIERCNALISEAISKEFMIWAPKELRIGGMIDVDIFEDGTIQVIVNGLTVADLKIEFKVLKEN